MSSQYDADPLTKAQERIAALERERDAAVELRVDVLCDKLEEVEKELAEAHAAIRQLLHVIELCGYAPGIVESRYPEHAPVIRRANEGK